MDLYDKIKRNPKNINPRELINLLQEYGFEYKRTRGDHEQYKREGYRTFPVPICQKPLAVRIVKTALRLIEEIRENEQNNWK
ncbi:MAG: type II toxin-antitoxin system HicA family toxin [Anaerolineaceae bacterium]|nr:type II toxin-antitoxin system HicA family toxin [Anaerolineaceae bacterium]